VKVMNATAPIEVFSLTGAKVKEYASSIFGTDELAKGAYIIKSGNLTARILIK